MDMKDYGSSAYLSWRCNQLVSDEVAVERNFTHL